MWRMGRRARSGWWAMGSSRLFLQSPSSKSCSTPREIQCTSIAQSSVYPIKPVGRSASCFANSELAFLNASNAFFAPPFAILSLAISTPSFSLFALPATTNSAAALRMTKFSIGSV